MRINLNVYPNAKRKAITMSYDDGVKDDRRLVEIFNTYGIKGSFHLNSGTFGGGNKIDASEVSTLYSGHEVSCHSAHHPFLELCSREGVVKEMLKDRETLEKLCGYPVRGMSYPFGTYNSEVVSILRSIGIEYSRTTQATNNFRLPADFLMWHPTCHHNGSIMDKLGEFKSLRYSILPLFYIWGHAYEFPAQNNWDIMERFCEEAAKLDDVWFATNIQIVDYVNALKVLRFNVEETIVYNPSAMSVWIEADGGIVEIKAGETVKLG